MYKAENTLGVLYKPKEMTYLKKSLYDKLVTFISNMKTLPFELQ